MTELLCFHGSPGLPEDFQFLQSEIPSSTCLANPREGYPGFLPFPAKTNGGRRIVVGYSWGVRSALEWASHHAAEIDEMVFISPFLQPSLPTSALTRMLLSVPLLGKWLLKKKAPAAIDAFLKSSSYPAEVPANYQALKSALSNPDVLLPSVVEKTANPLAVDKMQQILSSKPVLIIWGSADKNEIEATHVATLRSLFPKHRELKIPEGGHALVYTHPKILAEEIRTFLSNKRGQA